MVLQTRILVGTVGCQGKVRKTLGKSCVLRLLAAHSDTLVCLDGLWKAEVEETVRVEPGG